MSKYNPYEPKKDKKRRIQSNVAICVIIALFIFGIVLMLFPRDYGKKYYFQSTETEAYDFTSEIAESNEFYDIYTAMLKPGNEYEMDKNFAKEFPTATKLLDMDSSVYNENKPYILYGGKHIAVSQSFFSTNENIKTLDVALFGFEPKYEQNKVTISVNEMIRYSLTYNSRTGSVNYVKYDPKDFKMQMTNFAVSLEGGTMQNIGYTLNLKPTNKLDETEKKLLKGTVVDETNNSVHDPSFTETSKGTAISLSQKASEFKDKKAKYKFDLAGDAPKYFKSFVIEADFQNGTLPEDISYNFKIS